MPPFEDDEDSDQPAPEPTQIVRRLFPEWRTPRRGASNPERMTNPVWEWIIASRQTAYAVNDKLGGPSSIDAGPCWCFYRYGQSITKMPDGRRIYIAGEHEDHYDPDFFIYNDVVVKHPDGSLEIFGYPAEIFPPTDFHSATLVNDSILIIGNLGYMEQRRPGTTPIFRLDLKTFAITKETAAGSPPGWIYEHSAKVRDGGIVVSGGKIDTGREKYGLVENFDDWKLDLGSMHWERLTRRRWHQWHLRLGKGMMNSLYKLSYDRWTKIFRPAMEHVVTSDAFDLLGLRITVNGVSVRYVEDVSEVRMIIEGDLPEPVMLELVEDLRAKLSVAEKARYEAVRIERPDI